MRNYSAYREWWRKKDRGERQRDGQTGRRGRQTQTGFKGIYNCIVFFIFQTAYRALIPGLVSTFFEACFGNLRVINFDVASLFLALHVRDCARVTNCRCQKWKAPPASAFQEPRERPKFFSHIDYCAFFWVNPVGFEKNSWVRLVVKFLSSRGRPCNLSGKTWKSTKLELWGAIWSSPH